MREQIGDVTLIRGDCLEVMPTLAAGSVAFVFADLPYATIDAKHTDCAWDTPFDVAVLHKLIKRLVKRRGLAVFMATMRLAGHLISSCHLPYRYDIVWQKTRFTGHLNAKKMPLRAHELMLVFYDKLPVYNPQLRKNLSNRTGTFVRTANKDGVYSAKANGQSHVLGKPLLPISVISAKMGNNERGQHPTQKPVALLEWLIRTYTNDGDTILDPVAGSGTTAIAAMRVGNRKVVCIEKDATYYDIMVKRVQDEQSKAGA